MSVTPQQREIIAEICRALLLLGAESDLLGTVGSWGDSLPESVVLDDLRSWNEETTKELTDRISQMRTSFPHPSHNRDVAQRTIG
jgi:hypothetical protein